MLLRAGVFKGERMRYTLAQLDEMNGHEFEYAVADLLFHNGWRDVEVTQGSGDYGVDVLARRKNMRYGIQCKRYKGSIGVKAVQEAISGTDFYHRDIAAVITNSTYTKQAVKLAQTSGVRLFGRDFLEELIENSPRGRFLRFPTKYDIHEYSIMESFVESLPSGAARQELAHAIRGKGAFRRFKNGVYYHRIKQQWFDYQAEAYREIAIRWCRDEGIDYVETE